MHRLKFSAYVLTLAALLWGSAAGENAPASLSCEVKDRRPQWLSEFEDTERRWGVSAEAQLALISEEWGIEAGSLPSAWIPYWLNTSRKRPAIPPGYLDATWRRYEHETGNTHASYKKLSDFSDFIGWYVSSAAQYAGLMPGDAAGMYIVWKRGPKYYAQGGWRSDPALVYRAERFAERAQSLSNELQNCPVQLEEAPNASEATTFEQTAPPERGYLPWSWKQRRGYRE